MSKIRIATIIWKDGFGGAERSLYDLALGLDRSRVDMRFYFLSGVPGYFAEQIGKLGYKTVFLNWRNGLSIAGRWRLIKALRLYNPDVVHDHIVPPLTRPVVKLGIGCPIVYTEHGVAIRRAQGVGKWWRKILECFDFLFCDLILANSKASYKALRRVHKIVPEKIKVVYLGINLAILSPGKAEADSVKSFRIGYVGRINNKYKGVDCLPSLAKELCKKKEFPFEFVVAGDGPDRIKTESLCHKLGVAHLFHFCGWVQDVKSVLARLNVLIIPSRYESFGLTALEALAMNIPVIASDVGGLHEILNGCPSAVLVPPEDIKAMAKAVMSIANMPDTQKKMGRSFIMDKFSNIRMASDLTKIYEILSANRF